jgi:hypothetical protein
VREYKLQIPGGGTVDLDDPKTYEYLPNTHEELDRLMFREIGYALCYMDFFSDRVDLFPKEKQPEEWVSITEWYPNHPNPERKVDIANCSYNQRLRINEKIKNFCDNRKHNYNNLLWYKEQIFLFQDEIENMC